MARSAFRNRNKRAMTVWKKTPQKNAVAKKAASALFNAATTAGTYSPDPYIKGAAYAAKMAKAGYDIWAGTTPPKTKYGYKKWSGVSTGRYKGRFRKPRKVKTSLLSKSLQKGFAETSEYFGRVEDPECVYIGHSTCDVQAYANTISAMFIRDLFKKAGYNIANRLEELNLFGWDNSDGFKLEFVIQGDTTGGTALGAFGVSSYITTDNLTLTQIAQNFNGFNVWMFNYLDNNNTGSTANQIPLKLILYSSDRNALETNWRMASQIDLTYQHITFHAKSTLVVQNRTSAAGAATGDKNADRIDNQPLSGKLFHFNQATPRLGQNHTSIQQLQAIPTRGNMLVRAAEMTDGSLQNSPHAKLWTNCTKSSNILIQPGDMKQSIISHTFSGRLLTVLNRMRKKAIFNGEVIGGAGKFELVQLEEKLRTVSTNPVTVQYERKLELMCYSKKTKSPALTQTLAVVELNNIP